MPQSALDRELLLVPVPAPGSVALQPVPAAPVSVDSSGGRHAGRDQHAQRTDSVAFVVRSALLMTAILTVALVAQLALISGLEHRSAQTALFNQFRTELALGTAPTGPTTSGNHALPLGAPIAVLSIPSIGVHQVVVEGTTGTVLAKGPGHLRSTVFPGGAGTSVLYGRATAFGGPFGHIDGLAKGATITVTTGVGRSVFRVVDVRKAGAKVHPVAAGRARLILGTASGSAFVPSGVVLVDADKAGTPLAADNPAVGTVPASELPLGTDTSTLWALFFWLEVLAVLVAGAVWTWRRRGHAQAWIVFTAPLLLVWIFTADQVTRLLPNLL